MGDLGTKRYEFELEIHADRETVWETMVSDIGVWWPADYKAAGPSGTFIFDARPGGAVWEQTADGGLEWFRVQAMERASWVNLVGYTGPPWGGPSITMLRLDLSDADGGSTVLRVTDASLGQISGSAEEGWKTIFTSLQGALAN